MFRYASISSINIFQCLCTNPARNNIRSKLQSMKMKSSSKCLLLARSVSKGACSNASDVHASAVSVLVDVINSIGNGKQPIHLDPSILNEADFSSSCTDVRDVFETVLSSGAVSSNETLVDPPSLSSYNQTNYHCMSGDERLPPQCCFGPFHLSRLLPRSVYAPKSTRLESTQVDLSVLKIADSSSIGVGTVTETVLSSGEVSSAEAETLVDPAAAEVVHTLDEQTQFISDALQISVQNIEQVVAALATNRKPALRSLGLTDNSLLGFAQQALEFLHCDVGLQWWFIITTSTFVLRLIYTSLQVKSLEPSPEINKNVPHSHMQAMYVKLMEDDTTVFTKKDMNLYKCLWLPLCEVLVASYFLGLHSMARFPVESMKTGGIYWFKDLTLADPFYILPLTTWATLFIIFEMEPAQLPYLWAGQVEKNVKKALAIVALFLSMDFPAAPMYYLATWNVLTLAERILDLKLRTQCDIEESVRHDPDNLPGTIERFKTYTKERWDSIIKDKEMTLEEYDREIFKRAGTAPIIKTYRYDPTKVKASPSSTTKHIHAKSNKSV